MTARDAAMRLLNAPRYEWFRDVQSSQIDVTVGNLLATEPATDVIEIVRAKMAAVSMPAVATGIVLARPDARPLIEESLAAMPPRSRAYALHILDALLARIDLEWAWSVVRGTVVERGWCVVTAMVADVLGVADTPLPPTFAKPLGPLRLAAQMWRGDQAARRAIIEGIGGGRWRSIGSPQQLTWLAAGAVVDPEFVLDQLVAHPEAYDTREIASVLVMVASALAGAGRGGRFADAIPVDGDGDPEPNWLAVAIKLGVFADSARAREHVTGAIRRAERAEDDDRIRVIDALASLGDGAVVVELAERWHVSPTIVAVSVMAAGHVEAARRLIESDAWERLREGSRGDWEPEGRDWWYEIQDDDGAIIAACRDVAALAGHVPWTHAPGSVGDLFAMIRAGIEREQH